VEQHVQLKFKNETKLGLIAADETQKKLEG
jgi:hypothetical protein